MNATSPLGLVVPAQSAVGAVPIIAGGRAVEAVTAAATAAPAAAPATAPVMAPAASGVAAVGGTAVNASQGAAGSGSALPSLPIPDAMLSWAGYFEALALLCFVLALLWLFLWLLKKRGGGLLSGSGPAMRIESRMALGPKKWLVVARCLDKRLVLGVTDHQISLLTELPVDNAPKGMNKPTGPGGSFASLLKGGKTAPAE